MADDTRMTPSSDAPERNYYAEALAILKGETRMMPQREHLAAMLQQIANTNVMSTVLTKALISVMLEQKALTLSCDGESVKDIEIRQLQLQWRQDGPTRRIDLQVVAPSIPHMGRQSVN